ncbi:MAG: DUF1015 domain-containing protein [Bacillota bacterium]|nr:DUF1015 domain-containing protein [Bacillota bacterium]MDW7684156.1 DUF1015 domain-containing protein [Bacillota bacterium]
MANIVPIRGLRYNLKKAGDMSDLITPPYDVINEQDQQKYYAKSPYNIIRLEYGETRQADDENDNRYTRAAAFFDNWRDENILNHEDRPAVYLYEQEFTAEGRRMTRSGFMTGIEVEEYETGTVLPHEETLSKAKADRLQLLRHCRANFSPIFGLYDDPSLAVEQIAARYKQNEPDMSFTDENGEAHRIWVVSDPQDLQSVTGIFKDKKIYIADGHHRYETALNYHREMQEKGGNSYGFVLMTLVNLHDPGLVIFPTHRMVKNVKAFSPNEFLAKLSGHFSVTEINLPTVGRSDILTAELQKLSGMMSDFNAFLLYLGNSRLYRLTLPRNIDNRSVTTRCGSYSRAWRSLDVAVLQCLVLEDLLGIDREARAGGTNLSYTRDEASALARVDTGEYQAVFFLNPTLVREVTDVAGAGDKMPQKSTYFYPKLVTGLVINDFTV